MRARKRRRKEIKTRRKTKNRQIISRKSRKIKSLDRVYIDIKYSRVLFKIRVDKL